MWKVCSYQIETPEFGGSETSWMYYNDHNGYYLTCTRMDYAPIVGSGERDAMVAFTKSLTYDGYQNVQVMYVPSGKVYDQFGEITDGTPPDKYYDCVDNICKEVVSGQYKNDPKCAGKCKKETKTEIGNPILIVLGAGIGLGVLYYITQKKK